MTTRESKRKNLTISPLMATLAHLKKLSSVHMGKLPRARKYGYIRLPIFASSNYPLVFDREGVKFWHAPVMHRASDVSHFCGLGRTGLKRRDQLLKPRLG